MTTDLRRRLNRLETATSMDIRRLAGRPIEEWPTHLLCQLCDIDPEALERDDPATIARLEALAAGAA